jgi:hypothetical protein
MEVSRMVDQKLQPNPDNKEPLRGPGVIVSGASVVLGLLVTLGFKISPATQVQILTVLATATPLLMWAWGRRKVFSPATVHKMLSARGGSK